MLSPQSPLLLSFINLILKTHGGITIPDYSETPCEGLPMKIKKVMNWDKISRHFAAVPVNFFGKSVESVSCSLQKFGQKSGECIEI